MTGDEIDKLAPEYMDKLNIFISLNLKDDPALIYALCQVAHDRLQGLDESPENKGGIVSDITTSFFDLNKESLALYREMVRYLKEVTDSTVH